MSFKKTKHKKRLGRCFELAGSYVLSNPDLILVHGTIFSSAEPLAHAWVENSEMEVYDLVENKTYGPGEYYQKHDAKKIVTYTQKELAAEVVETGTWGPWKEKGYKDIPGLVLR